MKMDEHARAWAHEFVSGLLNNAAVTPEQRSSLHWEIMSHLHEAAERRAEGRKANVITLPDLQAVVEELGGPAGISAAFLENRVVATARAGFPKRLAAFIIDAFVAFVVLGTFSGIMGAFAAVTGLPFGVFGLVPFTGFMVWYAYLVLMDVRSGATLGKMALKLKTVMADGRPLTWEAGLIRNIAKAIPPLLVIDVLFYLIAFNREDQRASDRLAQTIVIDTTRPAWTPQPQPVPPPPPAVASHGPSLATDAPEFDPQGPRMGL